MKLRTAELCNCQINRICNIVEYLFSPDCTMFTETPKSFDSFELLSEITKNFSETVSKYISVKTECYSKLQKSTPVLVNKIKFEFMILSLFYCSLSTSSTNRSNLLKLTSYMTETQDSLIFHLRDNCNAINHEIIQKAFSDNAALFNNPDTHEALIVLSLNAAKKAAEEINGKLSYKALKSGNRYDIIVSKSCVTDLPLAKSPTTYTPSTKIYKEIFGYLELENQLSLLKKEGFGQ